MGIKLNCWQGSESERTEKIQREQWRNDQYIFLIISAFVKMERTLLLFYILSCIHKAIKGFINKSIFTMDMRLLRKRNRKSLSSLVSKSIVSKLFFLQNVCLSLGIFFHLPPPLSLFQRYSTISFDTCDLYYRIKPLDMY